MTAPYKLAAMQILILIWPPAGFGSSAMALPILYTMMELSIQYGNSLLSTYAYSIYGSLISWLIPDIDSAYQLSQISLQLLERLKAKEFLSKVLVNSFISIQHQKEPLATTIKPLLQAINNGLEVGDIKYACHAADYYCSHLFLKGEHLGST